MIVHLNGQQVPLDQARISPLDRGFLFGDGVYEGLRAFGGRIVGLSRHIARLRAGLAEARIGFDAAGIDEISRGLLAANGLTDAFVYVQVTRGTPGPGDPVRTRVAGRMEPTVFAYAAPATCLASFPPVPTKAVITTRDTRWLRGHLKSISLVGSVLAGYEAVEAGAEDAILIREEGDARWAAESTSANLIVVLADGRIVTPPMGQVPILGGVTLDILLEAARETSFRVDVEPVSDAALATAREVMLCGTLTMVTSVTKLDGRAVGSGAAGPVAGGLLDLLCRRIREGV